MFQFSSWTRQRLSAPQLSATRVAAAIVEAGAVPEAVGSDGGSLIVETAWPAEELASRLRKRFPRASVEHSTGKVIVREDGQTIAIRLVAQDRSFPPMPAHGSDPRRAGIALAEGTPRSRPTPDRNDSDGKRIVIVLDDVGFEHQPLLAAMRIDPDIGFAVIPGESNSAASASLLASRGFEVLCHLPIEPEGYPDVAPGPRAILTSMSGEEIRERAVENFRLVPQARGFNNHMGSKGTADKRVMEEVFAVVPADYFFLDSRTTSHSVATKTARERGVRAITRDVFLDDQPSRPAIRKQLRALAALAERRGIAVGIGHMYPSTIEVLGEEIPRLRGRGFRLIRLSEAVN